jgi:hypothetical protein
MTISDAVIRAGALARCRTPCHPGLRSGATDLLTDYRLLTTAYHF